MQRVTVDVEVGGLRVAYEGGRSFYERWVEPLVEGACRRASAEGLAASTTARAAEAAAEPAAQARAVLAAPPAAAAPGTGGPPQGVTASSSPARPVVDLPSDTWRPASPTHFQQYVAQVGDRAASPDKRAMAFAFYLWNYEKRESFSTAEAERFFRTVLGEPTEGLPELLSELAQTRGFLEAKGPSGPWALRKKGVGFVKARLLGQL